MNEGKIQTGFPGQMHWDHWLSPTQESSNSAGYAGY